MFEKNIVRNSDLTLLFNPLPKFLANISNLAVKNVDDRDNHGYVNANIGLSDNFQTNDERMFKLNYENTVDFAKSETQTLLLTNPQQGMSMSLFTDHHDWIMRDDEIEERFEATTQALY